MAHRQYSDHMETPKPQRTPQSADKYVLRLPDGMRDKLAALAKANDRSMNAEIVRLLQQGMDAHVQGTPPGIDVDALADTIADRVAARLKEGS